MSRSARAFVPGPAISCFRHLVDGIPPPGHFADGHTSAWPYRVFFHRRAPLSNVQAACLTSSGAIRGRHHRPQHDQGGLCRGHGRRRHDAAADRRSRLRGGASLGRCGAVGVPRFLHFRMGGPAAPCLQAEARAGLCPVRPRAGGRRRAPPRYRSPSLLGTNPKTAWLLGVLWMFKVVPGIPGLRQLRRVLVQESGPLLSVLVIFLMVLFLASVAVYFLERDVQPVELRQYPRGIVVGGGDPDHDGIWRRGADHAARPAGRGFCDDLRASACSGSGPVFSPPALPPRPAATISSRPGNRSARCRSLPRSVLPRSPTSRTCCAPWTCRRVP